MRPLYIYIYIYMYICIYIYIHIHIYIYIYIYTIFSIACDAQIAVLNFYPAAQKSQKVSLLLNWLCKITLKLRFFKGARVAIQHVCSKLLVELLKSQPQSHFTQSIEQRADFWEILPGVWVAVRHVHSKRLTNTPHLPPRNTPAIWENAARGGGLWRICSSSSSSSGSSCGRGACSVGARYINIYVYVYVCKHVYVYVCMYIYIYIVYMRMCVLLLLLLFFFLRI